MSNKSNAHQRVYRCAGCPSPHSAWQVVVSKINRNDNHSLWQVTDYPTIGNLAGTKKFIHLPSNLLQCHCKRDRRQTKISEQLFFNIRWVQNIVARNPSRSITDIDMDVMNKAVEKNILKQSLPRENPRRNAINQLKVHFIKQMPNLYATLPQYLRQFNLENQETLVALQGDQNNQFYCLFVGFPIACAQGKLTMPILMIDCFHYQCPSYDGITIALTSRTGFGLSVIFAFGIIPTEDTNNISWFLQLCLLHGVDFNCALFTDQGPLLSAANAISQNFGISFNLMLCLQHLICNIIHRFPDFRKKEMKTALGSSINEALSARNMDKFFFYINTMVEQFLDLPCVSIKTVTEMITYILQIHPSHWTVFANTPSFDQGTYDIKRTKLLSRVHSAFYLSNDFNTQEHDLVDAIMELINICNYNRKTAANMAPMKHIHNNNR